MPAYFTPSANIYLCPDLKTPFAVYCLLSTVYCLLSTFYCLRHWAYKAADPQRLHLRPDDARGDRPDTMGDIFFKKGIRICA